ncbi:MAG: hypothetical protein M0R22_13125 [Dehalococcoidia bacterium]|nr:hypothetical protein [Dehalococcoidia bacterium]
MTKEERDTFQTALDEWGPEAQVGMLHEEMGELMTVLNKLRRESYPGASWSALRGNALEEIEDVRIMLDQMAVMLKSDEAHQGELRQGKMQRLRELLRLDRKRNERPGVTVREATATVTERVSR